MTRNQIGKIALTGLILLLCGCGTEPAGNRQTREPADPLEGTWIPQALLYGEEVHIFEENESLADLYDHNEVMIFSDGTYRQNNNTFIMEGTWEPKEMEGFQDTYVLRETSCKMAVSSGIKETESNGKTQVAYLTKQDKNTMLLLDLDPENNEITLIYVREGKKSTYLDDEGSSSSTGNTSPGSETAKNDTSAGTTGQKNALKTAQQYLEAMAFSCSGLIEQLEYEGYTYEEAKWAADRCGADWKEQAVRMGKSYLNAMSFSRSELYEQLIYEGFSEEEAEYGVNHAY